MPTAPTTTLILLGADVRLDRFSSPALLRRKERQMAQRVRASADPVDRVILDRERAQGRQH